MCLALGAERGTILPLQRQHDRIPGRLSNILPKSENSSIISIYAVRYHIAVV